MQPVKLLKGVWRDSLAEVISSAEQELAISTPFVTQEGIDFVLSRLPTTFLRYGMLTFLTSLSATNLLQGSTDPHSLKTLAGYVQSVRIYHLSRIHAKVYVSDGGSAIITSGNLTLGGLTRNLEYGVLIRDSRTAAAAYSDLLDYANLGASIGVDQLDKYCLALDEVQQAYSEQQQSVHRAARTRFEEALQTANDELIRLQLSDGPIHSVFAKTIMYLLGKHRELTTEDLHSLIKEIHPELCDDTIDRVIDGKHFGKKWKHAVRTAQQHLARKDLVRLDGRLWTRVT